MPEQSQQQQEIGDRAVKELPTADFTMPRSAVWLTGLAVLLVAGSIWLALSGTPDFSAEQQQQQTQREEGEPWVMEGASEEVYYRGRRGGEAGGDAERDRAAGPEGQAEVALSRMDPATAARVLSRMDTQPAAETLALTPTWRVGDIFDEMQPDTAAQVFELLRRIDGRPRELLRGEAAGTETTGGASGQTAGGAQNGAGEAADDGAGEEGTGEDSAADGGGNGGAGGENGGGDTGGTAEGPAGGEAEGAGQSGDGEDQPPGGVPADETNQT